MELKSLHNKDLDIAIELYIEKRKEFKGIVSFEEFVEQFLHRCDTCHNIICNLDLCKECDRQEEDYDLEYFDRNKEHYVYKLY